MPKPKVEKKRLDVLLLERGLAESRERAQALIMAGQVLVDGESKEKAGTLVAEEARVEVKAPLPYVSRGGVKLAHALEKFHLDVSGKVCLDVGASTGGFTDVFLQRGAVKVYAVDVGYGQLDWRLRQDSRVVLMERTNIRYLERLPEMVDAAAVDVSFISLALVLPVVSRLVKTGGWVVPLIKPQFEAGREQVGRGGVIRDPAIHRQVLQKFAASLGDSNLYLVALTASPIKGPAGNVEFLACVRKERPAREIDLPSLIEAALNEAQDVKSTS